MPKIAITFVMGAISALMIPAVVASQTNSSPSPVAPKVHSDVVYATVGGKTMALDLYLPANVPQPPLVVWVHGGAWRNGTKAQPPILPIVQSGFALASLDFRQSTDAPFPAMVHDIKAAIRFLRAKAGAYGYRTDRIAIAGDSSGAHLALLVGVSGGVKELEGTRGDHPNESSRVQAIVDYYGATDLTTILAQSTPFGLGVREPALQLLLGALPDKAVDLAKLASPVLHVDRADPPLLIFHGDRDPQMPINQSHQIHGAYEQMGLDVAFTVVHGSAHGGSVFYTGDNLAKSIAFLTRTLGGTAPGNAR